MRVHREHRGHANSRRIIFKFDFSPFFNRIIINEPILSTVYTDHSLITILDLFEFNDFESIFGPIIAAKRHVVRMPRH